MSFSETYPDETPEDRAAELAIAERFRIATGARRLDQLVQGSRLDYLVAWPGGRRAWLEVKRCAKATTDLRSYFLAVGKWAAGIEWARATGSRFILAVEFADGDRTYVFHPDDITDRVVEPLSWNGIPVVAIPLHRMRTFSALAGLYSQRAADQGAVEAPVAPEPVAPVAPQKPAVLATVTAARAAPASQSAIAAFLAGFKR